MSNISLKDALTKAAMALSHLTRDEKLEVITHLRKNWEVNGVLRRNKKLPSSLRTPKRIARYIRRHPGAKPYFTDAGLTAGWKHEGLLAKQAE